MNKKTKKCTQGKRHKWDFVKNVELKRVFYSGSIEIRFCGLYRCKCGERKFGFTQPEAK